MTEMTGTADQESVSTSASREVLGAPEDGSVLDRLRGYVPWIAGGILLLALFSTLKWWGDQQQHATRQGRSWPPEPVKVFFGR
jgi:hypothetical protein